MALKDGRVDKISLEDWDAVSGERCTSLFYCIKTVLSYIQEQGGGSIVNIGSMVSCGGNLGLTAYACAKAGVDTLAQYTALQYGKQSIRHEGSRSRLFGAFEMGDGEDDAEQVMSRNWKPI